MPCLPVSSPSPRHPNIKKTLTRQHPYLPVTCEPSPPRPRLFPYPGVPSWIQRRRSRPRRWSKNGLGFALGNGFVEIATSALFVFGLAGKMGSFGNSLPRRPISAISELAELAALGKPAEAVCLLGWACGPRNFMQKVGHASACQPAERPAASPRRRVFDPAPGVCPNIGTFIGTGIIGSQLPALYCGIRRVSGVE